MKFNKWFLACLSVLVFGTQLVADCYGPGPYNPGPYNSVPCSQVPPMPYGPGPFYPSPYSAAPNRPSTFTEDTFVRPEGYKAGCFRLYGEFIYWQAVQDQNHYAATLEQDLENLTQHVSLVNPNFKYKPGFRVGMSYDLPCSDWNIDLSWLRLHESINSNLNRPGEIIPLTFPAGSLFGQDPTIFGLADQATNSWRFNFDVVDLIFRRNCCLCGLAFSPYVGVKGAYIKQHQRIRYLGLFIGDFPLLLDNGKKNQFRGIGPSFGIDASWAFWNNFNLSAGLEFALLYGKFDVNQRPSITLTGITSSTRFTSPKKYRIRPTVDANISLDWNACLFGTFVLQLGVGYEVQYWWNQWQALGALPSLITGAPSPQGDLMMQGLTARLGVAF